jgi:hypothetical protein
MWKLTDRAAPPCDRRGLIARVKPTGTGVKATNSCCKVDEIRACSRHGPLGEGRWRRSTRSQREGRNQIFLGCIRSPERDHLALNTVHLQLQGLKIFRKALFCLITQRSKIMPNFFIRRSAASATSKLSPTIDLSIPASSTANRRAFKVGICDGIEKWKSLAYLT